MPGMHVYEMSRQECKCMRSHARNGSVLDVMPGMQVYETSCQEYKCMRRHIMPGIQVYETSHHARNAST